MALSLVGAGTAQFTNVNAATFSPTLPTGWAADDIFVLWVYRKDTTALTAPTGWTQWASLVGANGASARYETWWRRAVAGDAAPTLTMGSGTTSRGGQILAVRGCPTSGDPLLAGSILQNTVASAVVSTTDISPGGANEGLFLFGYSSGPTSGTTPTGFGAVSVARNQAGGVAVGWSERASQAAGSFGAPTTTLTGQTNAVNTGVLIALSAATVAGVGPPPARRPVRVYTRRYTA